jgi:Cu2+-exporting ATPase
VGYEAHELDPGLLLTATDRQGRDLLMRLGVAFFSDDERHAPVGRRLVGGRGATRDMFHWISAAIALPTVVFAGQPFFKRLARAAGGAAGDGCADLAGADPGQRDLAL